MFDRHCGKQECINCNCQVMLNEDYIGCHWKYIKIQLNQDIQDMFDKIADVIG